MTTLFRLVSLKRLSGRIFWAFTGLAVLMLLAGIGAFFLLSTNESSNREVDARQRQLDTLKDLRNAVEQQRIAQELVVASNMNNGLQYLEAVRTRTDQITNAFNLDRDFPESSELGRPFRLVFLQYQAIGVQISQNRQRNLIPEQERANIGELKNKLDLSADDTGILLNESRRLVETSAAERNQVINSTRTIYIVAGFVLFGVAVLFAALVSRFVAQPLDTLNYHLRRIARGDLSQDMPTTGAEEAVALGIVYNQTLANLKLAIARIAEQATIVTTAAEKINQSSDNQVSNLSEQAVGLSEISTTAVELSDTAQQIAESASLVAYSANNALDSASEGYETLVDVNQKMSEIKTKVNLIADRILELNQVAQRIREITILIDMLSSETHLLALNAAIESAGAGEEGARFAVVAGNVRKLSQRSRKAAVEIQQLVSQIQRSAASSVMATEEGIKAVQSGEKLVVASLQANENIIKQIGQTNQLASAISTATAQQRIASNQVADTMQQLSDISTSITFDSQGYLTSANDLLSVVAELNYIVGEFQLEPDLEAPINLSDSELMGYVDYKQGNPAETLSYGQAADGDTPSTSPAVEGIAPAKLPGNLYYYGERL